MLGGTGLVAALNIFIVSTPVPVVWRNGLSAPIPRPPTHLEGRPGSAPTGAVGQPLLARLLARGSPFGLFALPGKRLRIGHPFLFGHVYRGNRP